MYQLHFLKKENDLNKIIKTYKAKRQPISILYVSLWDETSMNLVESLRKKYGENEEGQDLYIVDSFHMPHSFVIHNTTKLPHLVQLSRSRVKSVDYLSLVMDALHVT